MPPIPNHYTVTAKTYFVTYFQLTNAPCPIEVFKGLPWSKRECLSALDDLVDRYVYRREPKDTDFRLASLAHTTATTLRQQ